MLNNITKLVLSVLVFTTIIPSNKVLAQTASNDFSVFVNNSNELYISTNNNELVSAKKKALAKCKKPISSQCRHVLSGSDRYISTSMVIKGGLYITHQNSQVTPVGVASGPTMREVIAKANRHCETLNQKRGICQVRTVIDQQTRRRYSFVGLNNEVLSIADPVDY